jgi:hypothetical protein
MPNAKPIPERHPLAHAVISWQEQHFPNRREFAEAAGVSHDNVQKWACRPGSKPDIDDLRLMEHRLGLGKGYFLKAAGYVDPDASLEEFLASHGVSSLLIPGVMAMLSPVLGGEASPTLQ